MGNRSLVLAVGCAVAGVLGLDVVSGSASQPSTRVLVRPGHARLWVDATVAGAFRRLNDARCQELLGDFVDGGGRTLLEVLVTRRQTLSQHVHSIWFVDGQSQPQCRRVGLGAFTSPGSPVIFMCARLFRLQLGSKHNEMLVIHELLHTLGLGENPPTGDQITEQVRKRCGGVP